jgi:hypothetical protein
MRRRPELEVEIDELAHQFTDTNSSADAAHTALRTTAGIVTTNQVRAR